MDEKRSAESQNALGKVALALAIIGAINWGLVGFFNWNLVDALLGGGAREETSAIARVIYALVGLAGLALLALAPKKRLSTRIPLHRRSRQTV
jgi:uncharacterized protein